ncbi:MAG: Hint domain-containing protein [Solirubrobacteraceae bacterium]
MPPTRRLRTRWPSTASAGAIAGLHDPRGAQQARKDALWAELAKYREEGGRGEGRIAYELGTAAIPGYKALRLAGVGRAVARAPISCANSFPAGTPVLTGGGGRRPIAALKVGDQVIATDPSTGKTRSRRIEHVIVHDDVALTTVRFEGGRISVTPGHRFWAASRGEWVEASRLRVGDELRTPSGRRLRVGSTQTARAPGRVFNLTVAGVHTYYAGERPVLVHNSGGSRSYSPCARRQPLQPGQCKRAPEAKTKGVWRSRRPERGASRAGPAL